MFKIYDSYGDGGVTYSLKDSDGLNIHTSSGDYGAGENIPFKVVKEGQVSAITNLNNSSLSVKTYPNPACDLLYVDFNLEKSNNVEIKIYNLSGSLIKSIYYGKLNSGNKNFEININDMKPGMYYLFLDTEKTIVKKKISIIK